MKEMIEIEGIVIASQKGKVVIESKTKIYVVRNRTEAQLDKADASFKKIADKMQPKRKYITNKKWKNIRFTETELDVIKKNHKLGAKRVAKLLGRPKKQVWSKMYRMKQYREI